MSCQEVRGEVAVAVLTRRPLPTDVGDHLTACPGCEQEYLRLAVLPELLAATRDAELAPAVVAEPALLDRLLGEVRRRHRRRRVLAGVGIAAAVVAVAAATSPLGTGLGRELAGGPRPTPSGSAPVSASASAPASTSVPASDVLASGTGSNPQTGAGAQVKVRQGAWGSDLEVRMNGLAAGRQCRLVVIDAAGRRTEAGSWTIPSGRYPGDAGFHETVKTAPKDLVRAEILDDGSGATIVVVPLTRT